jgi:hypothetical protein
MVGKERFLLFETIHPHIHTIEIWRLVEPSRHKVQKFYHETKRTEKSVPGNLELRAPDM